MLTVVAASESQSEERPSLPVNNGKKNSISANTHKHFQDSPKHYVQQQLQANEY